MSRVLIEGIIHTRSINSLSGHWDAAYFRNSQLEKRYKEELVSCAHSYQGRTRPQVPLGVHSQSPLPHPIPAGPWSLPVKPPQRGLLLCSPTPGRAFLLIILPQPLFPLPTQDTEDQVGSLGRGGGQLWPHRGRTQVSGLPWRHHRPCPKGLWVLGRPPTPCLPEAAPPCPCLYSFTCPPNIY